MKQKPTQQEVANYLNLIRDSQPPGIAIARALIRHGYTELEINRYLQSEGMSKEDAIRIIREINKDRIRV